jgi:hypothetical protein
VSEFGIPNEIVRLLFDATPGFNEDTKVIEHRTDLDFYVSRKEWSPRPVYAIVGEVVPVRMVYTEEAIALNVWRYQDHEGVVHFVRAGYGAKTDTLVIAGYITAADLNIKHNNVDIEHGF